MSMRPSYYFSSPLITTLILVCYLSFLQNIYIVNARVFPDENLQRPEVRIPSGNIRGVNMVTRFRRKIFGFLGIPFAEPPLGNLRFRKPVPVAAWNDTFDGSIDSKPCPQLSGTKIIGNEDCLYVNVYTPRLPVTENSTLLPVMVFVYGGKFQKRSNDLTLYGPGFMLDKDVILVFPNYRLGVFGFLGTGDESSPGNYGLKDLVLALEWTRDNIRYFGGDPNRVTLAGGSSGALAVHLLTLSDPTKGLFHRYITQSGSALLIDACRPRQAYAKLATRLGEYLGCPTNTSAVLVECLRGLEVSQLININPAINSWTGFPSIVWGPTVEPEIEGALLTDSPQNIIALGKVRDLPWLESVNSDEGFALTRAFYQKPDLSTECFNNLDTLLPIILPVYSSFGNVTFLTDSMISYYFNNLSADPNLMLNNLTELLGDYIFKYPTYCMAGQQLLHAKQPHYLCSFEYRGTVSNSYMISGDSNITRGATHGDELFYLFPQKNSPFGPPGWELNENDLKMVDIMVQLWTSFITNGTPTTADPNGTVVWESYSSQHNYLRIGNGPALTLDIGYDLLQDRVEFWDELRNFTSWRC